MTTTTLSLLPEPTRAGRAMPTGGMAGCTPVAGELELLATAHALAVQAELWHPHVRHDRRQRTYHEVARTDRFSAWLICWMPGHDTGFHDHDGSGGVGLVLRGEVAEARLTLGGPPVERTLGCGQHFSFAAHDIHRVRHAGEAPAVTLHVYAPVLRGMGAYEIGDDGTLRRRALDEREELRPQGT